MVEFGEELEITYVMGGLAREFEADLSPLVIAWLDHAAESGMPLDPRVWARDGVRSTYPACIAFRAAAEQGPAPAERYLRVLREGFMCHGRKLDGPEALATEARRAGLDVAALPHRPGVERDPGGVRERPRGVAHDPGRRAPGRARRRGQHGSSVERLAFPALRFLGGGGEEHWVGGDHSYEEWRDAATAAGATPNAEPHPDVAAALRRFESMATAELEAVCDLPGPRAGAEVWRLASEWRVRRVPVLGGELWELA